MSLSKHSILSGFIDNPTVTDGFSKDIKKYAQYKETIGSAYTEFISTVTSINPTATSVEGNTLTVEHVTADDIQALETDLHDIVMEGLGRTSDMSNDDIDSIIGHYFNIKTIDDVIAIEKIR